MSKKALIIIAFNLFRDEEYLLPKEVLEKAGIATATASAKLGAATGKFGAKAPIDITLDQVSVKDYDAILFIGGQGSYGYYDDKTALTIAQTTVKEGKILGAICAAPGILVHAGLLKGKKATITPSEVDLLRKGGAIFQGNGVEIDGKIITADGPQSAQAWGEAIVKALDGK